MTWILVLLSMATFTSCDKDVELAYRLDGVWQGEIASEFFHYRWGHQVEFYETEICFHQAGAFEAGGTGYELDLSPHGYTRSYFHWTVRNGRIYLDYDDATNTVAIRDYNTYWNRGRECFSGFFEDMYSRKSLATFNLVKVASNDYYENRFNHYDEHYYYAPQRPDSLASASD
jgi:hypothetical protein